MEIDFKIGILVLFLLLLLSFTCRQPIYLTEASGKVHNTEDCKDDYLYIYENLNNSRAVDSAAISSDGAYYVAFSGASLLELRGSENCGSDYHIIAKGFRQTKDFSFKPVRSGIVIKVNPERINSNIKILNINLERMLEGSNNSLIPISKDFHNVNIQLQEPLDTLLNLTLVDQQFYRLHISGLDSMNISTLSIIDTIKVDAQLSEIVL